VRVATGFVCVGALLLAGCASIGPTTVARDRFDYVTALSDSSKQQMLLNLLKVRYGEAPVFMDVASLIGAYTLEGTLTGIGSYAIPGGGYRNGDQIASVQAQGTYADRPTITYQPLAGEKFAKSLMTPLPVSGILLLIQSGYAADLMLRLCVNTINGLENAYGGSGSPRAGSRKFYELLLAVRQAQAVQALGFRIRKIKGTDEVIMFVRPTTPETAVYTRKIRQLLRLNPTKREFRVVSGAYADNDSEIAIQARSMLQIIIDFGSYVDVPETDVAEGRVFSPQRDAEHERMFPRLITVRQGPSRPDDAFVAVQYRNYWFWIDDRDARSKQILSVLMLMFSLTETSQAQPAPVVTIPAR
jgi:hypothetical protein